MTRDDIIEYARTEYARTMDADSVHWEMLFKIADEKLSSEEGDPDYIPWSQRPNVSWSLNP